MRSPVPSLEFVEALVEAHPHVGDLPGGVVALHEQVLVDERHAAELQLLQAGGGLRRARTWRVRKWRPREAEADSYSPEL